MPRAKARRGGRGERSAGFYAQLAQIRPSEVSTPSSRDGRKWITKRPIIEGEYVGLAHSLTVPRDRIKRGPPSSFWSQYFAAEREAAGRQGLDDELGMLLGAIAYEVQQITAAVRRSILAEFAGRAAYARKHIARPQLAGVLQAIAAARTAALALAQRNAKLEMQGRKRAALAARPTRPRKPSMRSPKPLRGGPKRR